MTVRTLAFHFHYLLRVDAVSSCLLKREIGEWVYFRRILLCSLFLATQGKTNSLVRGTEGSLTLTLTQCFFKAGLPSQGCFNSFWE